MNELTILWLDDQRDPYRYFDKKSESNAFLRNKQFYDDLIKQYNVNFVWVKNLYQFIDYIEKNGAPEFVSFDHDLNNHEGGEGLDDEQKLNNNGVNAAKWLVNYCKQNNQQLPKFYIHSANPKRGPEINKVLTNENNKVKKIILKESQIGLINIDEDVFASRKKGRNKIQLSYNKRTSDKLTKNFGQLNPGELLNTGKMDQNNSDTYEVPLKGGIMSYNITSIRGTEIMHYFKNKHAQMSLDLNGDGEKETYELFMEDPEYQEFFSQFYNKVNNVVSYVTNKLYQESNGKINFSGVSIYPVPSSSNFNVTVANQLQNHVKLNGLPVVTISTELFKKDLSNLQKDEDFINKNKQYYSSRMFKAGEDNSTHEQYIDNELNRFSKIESVKPLIDEYNKAYIRLDRCYSVNRKQYGDRFGEALSRFYLDLYNKFTAIENSIKGIHRKNVYDTLKGTKSQVEAKKTEDIWNIVKPYLRGTGVRQIPMHRLQPQDFQIKKMSNDVRMGMKNYFVSNPEVVQEEMDKIKGTVFVIFDDNISGGATLSDICMQAKQLGIEYIIPITFGEMSKKYSLGIGNMVNKPTKNGNFENY